MSRLDATLNVVSLWLQVLLFTWLTAGLAKHAAWRVGVQLFVSVDGRTVWNVDADVLLGLVTAACVVAYRLGAPSEPSLHLRRDGDGWYAHRPGAADDGRRHASIEEAVRAANDDLRRS